MRLLLGIPYGDSRYFDFDVRVTYLGWRMCRLEKIAELG